MLHQISGRLHTNFNAKWISKSSRWVATRSPNFLTGVARHQHWIQPEFFSLMGSYHNKAYTWNLSHPRPRFIARRRTLSRKLLFYDLVELRSSISVHGDSPTTCFQSSVVRPMLGVDCKNSWYQPGGARRGQSLGEFYFFGEGVEDRYPLETRFAFWDFQNWRKKVLWRVGDIITHAKLLNSE